jgi:dCTP diphosphatase
MSAGPPMRPRSDLDELRDALRTFAAERDWEQFHTPRNLATALIVECAELLEHFQWLGDGPAARLPDDKQAAVREELADVLLYLVRLSDRLGVDLYPAALDKLEANARKYPVEKARGRSTKYTEW